MKNLILLLIALLLLSCNKSAQEKAFQTLNLNKSKWERLSDRNWEYELKWENSIYHPCQSGPFIVRTHNVSIDTAFYLNSDLQVYCKQISSLPISIDSLFVWLQNGIVKPAAHFGAEYDSVTGIPISGYIDFEEDVVDDEISFSISNIRQLDSNILTANRDIEKSLRLEIIRTFHKTIEFVYFKDSLRMNVFTGMGGFRKGELEETKAIRVSHPQSKTIESTIGIFNSNSIKSLDAIVDDGSNWHLEIYRKTDTMLIDIPNPTIETQKRGLNGIVRLARLFADISGNKELKDNFY